MRPARPRRSRGRPSSVPGVGIRVGRPAASDAARQAAVAGSTPITRASALAAYRAAAAASDPTPTGTSIRSWLPWAAASANSVCVTVDHPARRARGADVCDLEHPGSAAAAPSLLDGLLVVAVDDHDLGSLARDRARGGARSIAPAGTRGSAVHARRRRARRHARGCRRWRRSACPRPGARAARARPPTMRRAP